MKVLEKVFGTSDCVEIFGLVFMIVTPIVGMIAFITHTPAITIPLYIALGVLIIVAPSSIGKGK